MPIILSLLGIAGDVVMRILNIILIGVVLILLVYFFYDLFTCFGGVGRLR